MRIRIPFHVFSLELGSNERSVRTSTGGIYVWVVMSVRDLDYGFALTEFKKKNIDELFFDAVPMRQIRNAV